MVDGHTLKYMKKELYQPMICTRSSRDVWEKEGGKDLYQKAKERVFKILKEHQPEPLEEAVLREMRRIVEMAEKEITGMTTV